MGRDEKVVSQKAILREKMLSLRRSIPVESRTDMSNTIGRDVIGLPEIVNARHIHLYLSMTSHAEVDTAKIIEGLTAMDKQLSVPVIIDGKLFSAAFHKGDAVKVAQFGQPEPEVVSVIDESQLDVILIPLLAFDVRGYRLGYGKGFYDFFLQRLSKLGRTPFRIGLSFSRQMVDEVPADPWDEILDGVVHEHGIIRFT
ncbi:MAG: 5-formyltetrahydrofolate cyclo-ligase [Chlorobiales bacterium]|nr:5-formyltetrahydrofolate cyclo-ligase [Chlorobiales bacterium]